MTKQAQRPEKTDLKTNRLLAGLEAADYVSVRESPEGDRVARTILSDLNSDQA
jgi:hypothetical protein